MAISQFTQSIQEFFNDNWANETALAFDNIEFDSSGVLEFARLSIVLADQNQDTIGGANNRQFSTNFLTTVQIFTEPHKGRARSDELVQKVQEIFRRGDIPFTAFRMGVSEVGLSGGNYYQANVSFNCIDYQID